jgi:hypothetical protein
MIVYNKTWLNNLRLHNQAEALHNANCVTGAELNLIKQKYPVGFYTPGLVIRIGLFLLTCITVLFSFGLLTLLMNNAGVLDSFMWPLFLGIVCAAVLEIMVKNKHYYRAGVNDALLWMSATLIAGAFWWMLTPKNYHSGHADYLVYCLFLLAISLFYTLRYADILLSAASALSLFSAVFFFWIRFGFLGTLTVPFIIMIAAGLLYAQALLVSSNPKINHYSDCLAMVEIISLIVLYAAGNYFITDWANHVLHGIPFYQKLEVKWAPFFWLWTMLVPFAYILYGFLKKNLVTLRVGLILIGAAVFTFRTYYHVMSIELALLLSGIALLGVAYAAVRFFKMPKHGFTAADLENLNAEDVLKMQGLFTAATFTHSHPDAQSAEKFGGGNFGGGGSGGKF